MPRSSVFAAVFLLLLSLHSSRGAEVSFTWDPNTEPDLAGYKLHFGHSSRNYSAKVDVGNTTFYTLMDLADGLDYYFAVTAYNIEGDESGYSNEVFVSFPKPSPGPIEPPLPEGPRYSISVATTGGGSAVVASPAFVNVASGEATSLQTTSVPKKSVVSVEFKPAPGHYLAAIKIDGKNSKLKDRHTFSNIKKQHLIEILFAKKGDLNADGKIDRADYDEASALLAKPKKAKGVIRSACDVSPEDGAGVPLGDGVITVQDVEAILQWADGKKAWGAR